MSPARPAAAPPAEPAAPHDRPLAAFAYAFTVPSGIIALLVAGRHRHYVRWNAIQAIGLGLTGLVLAFLASLLSVILFAAWFLDGRGPPWYISWGGLGVFGALVTGVVVVLIVASAVRAYRGRPLRLPLLARVADRYARENRPPPKG